MTKSTMLTGALLAAALVAPSDTAAADGGLKVWIEPVLEDGLVEFSSYVSAAKPVSVTYHMKITRVGQGGTSSTTQSGRKVIAASGQATVLSRTGMNLGPKDRIDIDLTAEGSNGETATYRYSTD